MKPHQCGKCHKTFKHTRDAIMHIRDAHDGTAEVIPTGKRRYDMAVLIEGEGSDQEATQDVGVDA